MTLERRTYSGKVEFRREGDSLMANGYAYVFDALSDNLGGFVERVARGAGAKTMQEQDIVALANHDPNLLLGRMSSGTLRLEENDKGAEYEIDLPDTSTGRDWANLLERRDVIGSSFGFRVIEDEWGETPDGFPLRTLKAFSLRDVGPVTFPAYSSSEAALRSLAEKTDLTLPHVVDLAAKGELLNVISPAHEPESAARNAPILITHRRRRLR